MGTPHGGADTRQNATGSQRGPVQSKQQQEAPRPLLLGSRRGRVSLLWGSRIRPRLTVGLSHSGCSPGQRQEDGAECEPWLATLLQARPAPTTRGRQKVAVSLEPFWGERGGRHPQAWTRALLPEMRGWQPAGLVLWSEGEWGSPAALGSEVPSDSTGARRNHTKLPVPASRETRKLEHDGSGAPTAWEVSEVSTHGWGVRDPPAVEERAAAPGRGTRLQGPILGLVLGHDGLAFAHLLAKLGHLRPQCCVLLLQEGRPDGDLVFLQASCVS